MMAWIASFFLNVFTAPVLSFVSNVIGSLTNEKIAVVQAQTGLAAAEALDVVQAESARINAQATTQMAAMSHKIWWWAWGLFVIPPALYDAAIHIKSLLCMFAASAEACNKAWVILEVPATMESWDHLVVLSMFGLAVTSSVVTSIANRIGQAPK
jgi:hypothetical protein